MIIERSNWELVGVYFLMNKTRIVYIGATTNFLSRWVSHCASKMKFDSARLIQCEASIRFKYEKRWIIKFRPKYNRKCLWAQIGPYRGAGERKFAKINLKKVA